MMTSFLMLKLRPREDSIFGEIFDGGKLNSIVFVHQMSFKKLEHGRKKILTVAQPIVQVDQFRAQPGTNLWLAIQQISRRYA